jgi:N-methylhydantoinase A
MIASADAAVARALRRVSVERGVDPRSCVLVAFGGAGPLHACGLAERLGMTRVLVPPHAGVLSALGLAVAPERRVAMASVMRTVKDLSAADLASLAAGMAERSGAAPNVSWIARARYRGQGHELEVPLLKGDAPIALGERFTEMHQRRYGFVLDVPVEIVSARCVRSGAAAPAALARRGASRWGENGAMDDGGAFDAVVVGPATVALPDATMLVSAGWEARALPIGGWLIEQRVSA